MAPGDERATDSKSRAGQRRGPARRRGSGRVSGRTARELLSYCKACEIEDFGHPDLLPIIQEVFAGTEGCAHADFPLGREDRKHWEVAMSIRALRDHRALRTGAEVLGVGAGREATIFYLTEHVGRVYATDLYLSPGDWATWAPPLMLVAPERVAPMPFTRERLVVQHMDGRWLRHPDASFDGVFSTSSIEHFGPLPDIAAAAFEMGRVLKPNGILSLSTELKLAGPPDGTGWPGVLLFDRDSLWRYVVEASGLELVDEPDLSMSEITLTSRRALDEIVADWRRGDQRYPQVVFTNEGYVFNSVHLTFRKTERYPASDNSWARPSEELRDSVRRREAEAIERLTDHLSPATDIERPREKE